MTILVLYSRLHMYFFYVSNKGMVRTVVARSTTHETSFESRQEIIDNHHCFGLVETKLMQVYK
ncbi:hypothetical protein C0J52_11552 [Blattella germanica]|nr:hypothetical protein C0J52_11552 [Blattella germanica]